MKVGDIINQSAGADEKISTENIIIELNELKQKQQQAWCELQQLQEKHKDMANQNDVKLVEEQLRRLTVLTDEYNKSVEKLQESLQLQQERVGNLNQEMNANALKINHFLNDFKNEIPPWIKEIEITPHQYTALKEIEDFDFNEFKNKDFQAQFQTVKETVDQLRLDLVALEQSGDHNLTEIIKQQEEQFKILKDEFETVWKSKPPFEEKKEFMKKYKSLEHINDSPNCLLVVFNTIQAKLNQHFQASLILTSGKVEISSGKIAQAMSILAVGVDVLPFGGTASSVGEYFTREAGKSKRLNRYEHFNALVSNLKADHDPKDVFKDIALGIVLTDQANIEHALKGDLEKDKVAQVRKELNTGLKNIFGSTTKVNLGVYAEFLANRAKENILNGNLNRRKLIATSPEEENLTTEKMIENIIMHTTKKDTVIRYLQVNHTASQQQSQGNSGDPIISFLQQEICGLKEEQQKTREKLQKTEEELQKTREKFNQFVSDVEERFRALEKGNKC
jgi:hypothetical protein